GNIGLQRRPRNGRKGCGGDGSSWGSMHRRSRAKRMEGLSCWNGRKLQSRENSKYFRGRHKLAAVRVDLLKRVFDDFVDSHSLLAQVLQLSQVFHPGLLAGCRGRLQLNVD